MTQAELVKELREVVSRVAYLAFKEKQPLPYIVYCLPDTADFHADNAHCVSIQNGWLELYMSKPDFALMAQVEDVFIKNELPWEKENEDYLDSEKVFYARWNFQLL